MRGPDIDLRGQGSLLGSAGRPVIGVKLWISQCEDEVVYKFLQWPFAGLFSS
jgi:hypothetical protein